MAGINGSSRGLDGLVKQGLSMEVLSNLVGCSVVTLYRARNGKQILDVYLHRLTCVERFCDEGKNSVDLLTRIAKTYSEAAIWEQGLQVVAQRLTEENRS